MTANRSAEDVILDLKAAYPREPFTPERILLMIEDLSDLPIRELETAAIHLRRTSDFCPSVSSLREAVAEMTLALPDEVEALCQVERRMDWARQGDDDRGDATVVHPLVREALEHVGGFAGLREADRPSVVRGQFLGYYRTMRARALRAARIGSPTLPAGHERAAIGGPADG